MSDESKGSSNEPSMEEILASIRRIIAEDAEQDGKAAAGDPPPQRPAAEEESAAPHWPEDREADPHPAPLPERTPLPEDDEGVEPLELTQLVNEDGSVTDLSRGSASAMPFVAESADEFEESQAEPEEDIREETRDDSQLARQEETRRREDSQPVVQTHYEASPGESREEAAETEAEAEEAELDEDFVAAAAVTAAAVAGDDTEEDPAQSAAVAEREVRAWLDRNLPDIVERVVREEVERMLRRLKDG